VLGLPTLAAGDVALRPLRDEDLDPLVDILRAPGVAEWWGDVADRDRARDDLRDDGAFVIEAGGTLAGWLCVSEEDDPGYRHAALDLFLAPAHQGRGVGPAALRLAIHWLLEDLGHHRVTIDPAASNVRAIRAYSAVGFRPVGVMRRYERGADGLWHDNLLMDLLAGELQDGPARP
jgi:aminoglycoside 6'-N-acetyltransferase